jgi:hypothetical protein
MIKNDRSYIENIVESSYRMIDREEDPKFIKSAIASNMRSVYFGDLASYLKKYMTEAERAKSKTILRELKRIALQPASDGHHQKAMTLAALELASSALRESIYEHADVLHSGTLSAIKDAQLTAKPSTKLKRLKRVNGK